jgi:hypothetical protein
MGHRLYHFFVITAFSIYVVLLTAREMLEGHGPEARYIW